MEGQSPTEHLGDLHDGEKFARLVRLDPTWQEGLDRLTGLTRRILGVPLAQINVVTSDEQISLSSVALEPEWASWNGPRSTPLEATYCRHVISSGDPLVVDDARTHPLVKDNLATTEGGIRSYAAVPLKNGNGQPLATLCVVDFEERTWDDADMEALTALAEMLMREVWDRIHAEVSLERRESRFRALIENGEDLITVLDADGRIEYHSPAYERSLGYGPASLVGTEFAALVHPRDRDRWRQTLLGPLAEEGGRSSGELRLRHKEGRWRSLRGMGVNLLRDPAVGGIVLNLLDVTQERQFEAELQQAQKMEAIGRLAGGVAHDFNNLLTAIQGNTAFLLDRDDLPPQAAADVREIRDTAHRATNLTRQLLSFSRDQVMELKLLDLGALAEETAGLVKRLAGPKVTVETSFGKELPIVADESQVGQVIMNLAVNARDAMPDGGTLKLETSAFTATEEYSLSHGQMPPGEYAMLVVSDDGVGMTREVQAQIFEPFFTTKPDGEGTGLGLSISWGAVRQLNGHIHLYSEPGLGTMFRVYFPRAENGRKLAATQAPEEKVAELPGAPGNILVVEDQEDVRRVVTRVLEAAGHNVLEAASGEEALTLVENLDPPLDLVLSDVLLPGMKGTELAWELTKKRPELAVIFTSGFTRNELADQKVELRHATFLPKPFGPRELTAAVSQVLRRP